MSKIFVIIVSSALVLSLIGCSGAEKESKAGVESGDTVVKFSKNAAANGAAAGTTSNAAKKAGATQNGGDSGQ